MSHACRPLAWGTAVLLGLGLTAVLHAQEIRPAVGSTPAERLRVAPTDRRSDVNRLEVYNGLSRTVRYYGNGLSPGEMASVRDMERLENEASYTRDLQALKELYATDERFLEPYRRSVQQQLYGLDVTRTSYGMGGVWNPAFGGGLGYGGFGFGTGGLPGYALGGYGYGFNGTGLSNTGMLGGTTTVNRSLANGVGDEGTIKSSLARVMAQEATGEYGAEVNRAYAQASSRASTSPSLRVAFGLRSRPGEGSTVVGVAGEETSPFTLTLKGGEKVRGTKLSEDKDWYILDTPNGTVQLRQSEVIRIDKASTARGAAGSGR